MAKKKSKPKARLSGRSRSAVAAMRQAAKTKRPTRFRYDRDGNIIGFYVPLQHQSKAEQRRATKAMVSACSAGAYRQSVSPGRTCGYRALKPGSRAGQGLAYARWGFPQGWPKARFHNPAYSVAGLTLKTFKDEEGDWGYAVYSAMGEPLAINTGEPSEKVAAREGKAEARFQAEILSVEGESMRNPKKSLYGKAEIEKARKLGEAAFKAGKTSVPARDAALMGMLKPGPMGSSTSLLEAWANGWHAANLRAPVPNASRRGKKNVYFEKVGPMQWRIQEPGCAPLNYYSYAMVGPGGREFTESFSAPLTSTLAHNLKLLRRDNPSKGRKKTRKKNPDGFHSFPTPPIQVSWYRGYDINTSRWPGTWMAQFSIPGQTAHVTAWASTKWGVTRMAKKTIDEALVGNPSKGRKKTSKRNPKSAKRVSSVRSLVARATK
jgi:hypothetical protein